MWDEQTHVGLFDTDKSLHQACTDMSMYLAQWIELGHNEDIFVIGCGQGGTDRYFVRMFHSNVTGIDLSQKQLEKARSRALTEGLTITYLQESMENLPFPDQCFDVVWAQEVFSYSHSKNIVLNEFHRLLRPQGKLLIEDITLRDPSAVDEVNAHFGNRTQITQLPTSQEYLSMSIETGFILKNTCDLSQHLQKPTKKLWKISIRNTINFSRCCPRST